MSHAAAPAGTSETQPPATAYPRSGLARWGTWVALHPLRIVAAWVVVLVLAVLFVGQFNAHLGGNGTSVQGSESAKAAALVRASFPRQADETDLVVVYSHPLVVDDPAFRQVVAEAVSRYAATPRVGSVADPYQYPQSSISADRHTALVRVGITGGAAGARDAAGPLGALAGQLATDQIEVYFTGSAPLNAAVAQVGDEDLGRAERVGLPVAALVLLLAFGSVVAATIPLVLGFSCVLMTLGVLGVLGHVVTFDPFVRSAVSMVGIALGIDYSLFIVTRFREELARLTDPGRRGLAGPVGDAIAVRAEAVGNATATAVGAVLYSGTTVIISLSGLYIVRAAGVRAAALGMMTAVLVMLAIAATLLPALLALLGPHVNRLALPWARRSIAHPDDERSVWARLADVSMRRPVAVTAAAVVVLSALALPALGLHYGADTSAGATRDLPAGKGMTRISAAFEPGAIAPLSIVVSRSGGPLADRDLAAVADLTATARHEAGTASVTSVTDLLDQQAGGHGAAQLRAARASAPATLSSLVDSAGRTTIITVVPSGAPDSDSAQDLVRHLRTDAASASASAGTGLTILVGGSAAQLTDMVAENSRATPMVIAAVLGASWLLLFWAFRSVLLPFKAILMNLFSVGAAFGTMVLVFQDGHGASLLGADRTGFIQVMIPLLAFALVFGLSMDYEVFMLSRMREAWQHDGDNRAAVRTGIVRTAPVITAAAAIMIVVFAAFSFTRVTDLKQLGFMLAVAVFIDATVIRLLLVPALMRLMGHWNWWLPEWLSRRVGHATDNQVSRSGPQ